MVDILKVKTEFLLEETKTSGHAPLKFICNDNHLYYCKYLIDFDPNEINCLAYEIVAHYLLKALNIPTPDIALVQVSEGTLDKSKIIKNRRLRVNHICFGSKGIDPSEEITEFEICTSKRDYNRIQNPEDVVKIALFDLWINNVDRGRFIDPGFNYNLLAVRFGNQRKIMAFDHAFVFGGVQQIGVFNSKMPFENQGKFHQSDFYKSFIGYMDEQEVINIVDNFIPLLKISHKEVIDSIILQLTDIWKLTPNLADRIHDYLFCEERIEKVKSVILNSKSIF
ncbi:HipA family kinase [Flavobacterium sp. GSA192]|uniref:HipA family kinase n=1 Tax=Flavobacterium sp. GSA192 TaxID=2576304 RepID=UPI00112661EA|nr:HipA family kinase [Flavobacterium sp. GSA192]